MAAQGEKERKKKEDLAVLVRRLSARFKFLLRALRWEADGGWHPSSAQTKTEPDGLWRSQPVWPWTGSTEEKKEKSTTVSAAPLPHSRRLLPTFHCAALPLRVCRGQPCIKGLKAALTSPTVLVADQCESQQDQTGLPLPPLVPAAGNTSRTYHARAETVTQGQSSGVKFRQAWCQPWVRGRRLLTASVCQQSDSVAFCLWRAHCVCLCVSDHTCTVTHINSL